MGKAGSLPDRVDYYLYTISILLQFSLISPAIEECGLLKLVYNARICISSNQSFADAEAVFLVMCDPPMYKL